MGLVAEYEITCGALPLVEVADAVPDATLTVELQYNHGERPPFLVSVTGADPERVDRAFEDSGFAASYTLVGRAGDTRQFQVLPATSEREQLGDDLDLAGLRSLATAAAIVQRIGVRPTGWVQTVWFADRAAFDEYRTYWSENAEFTLHRLTRDGDPEPPGDGLTDPQREALRTAYAMGYFEIPRRASLEDVAEELDLVPSSVSERLRRAQTHLLETTVASTWPPLPE